MGLNATKKTIFVTVGTTLFEDLMQAATTEMALDWMCQTGYTNLILQYGKGTIPSLPEKYSNNNPLASSLQIQMYAFKTSLADDMELSDLIVSHAGAGTVMEVLRLPQQNKRWRRRRLAVVINTRLMDNHQAELAHAMETRKYLYVVEETGRLLQNVSYWQALHDFEPVPYASGCEHDFPRILDRFMGCAKEE